jgi:hypothetical protein
MVANRIKLTDSLGNQCGSETLIPGLGVALFQNLLKSRNKVRYVKRRKASIFRTLIQCCGSWINIPDPGSKIFRIRVKEFKYFYPKIISKLSEI